jgi:hypothetical protein
MLTFKTPDCLYAYLSAAILSTFVRVLGAVGVSIETRVIILKVKSHKIFLLTWRRDAEL